MRIPCLLGTFPYLTTGKVIHDDMNVLYSSQLIYLHFHLGSLVYKAQSLKLLCKEKNISTDTLRYLHIAIL